MIVSKIAKELSKTIKIKSDIRHAIINKSVDVPHNTIFEEYPEKIFQVKSSVPFSYYDAITMNGTNYSYLFHRAVGVNRPDLELIFDLSNWDTSNVVDMNHMFYICDYAVIINMSNFDMSNVINTENMFYYCYRLHTLRLDNCDNATIKKIIESSNFPTNKINGVTKTIYCKRENAVGLTPPTNWVFSFIDDDTTYSYNEETETITTLVNPYTYDPDSEQLTYNNPIDYDDDESLTF